MLPSTTNYYTKHYKTTEFVYYNLYDVLLAETVQRPVWFPSLDNYTNS